MKVKKIIFLVIVVLSGCSGNKDSDIYKVKLSELNSQPIDLEQFEGKTVFINFWATWCGPCIQEMPSIARAVEKLKNENIIFLLASNEETSQIEAFAKKRNYNFHYVRVDNFEALNIQALPATFMFNPEGKLKFSEVGFRIWDDPANIDLINSIINDHEK